MNAVDSYPLDADYEGAGILPPEEDQEHVLEQEDQEEEQEEQEQEEQAEEVEQEEQEDEQEDEGDLFGDDGPQDAEPRTAPTSEAPTTAGTTPTPGPGTDDGLTSPERRHRKALEYEEDDQDEPEEEVQLRDANVQIPNIPVPRSSDDNYWVIRLPNFIKLDSKPFHPDMYVGPEQEEDATGDADAALKERSLSIKMEVENTVRWRWTKDENGIDRKQSNSRVIRWSDGTMSVQLGKELFDVNQNIDTTATTSRQMGSQAQSQSQSQSQSQYPPSSVSRGQGLTYLVAQHKRAEVLQAERVITGHLTLRPTGMQSETHRKLVRAVGQKHSKVARLRLAPNELVQRDPDRELAELAKSVKKGGKAGKGKKEDGGLGGLGKKRSGGSGRRRDQMWSDDEDEGPVRGRSSLGGSDSEDFDLSPKKGDGKPRERGEYQMDDFVVSDEEDEEDEFGNPKSKKSSEKVSGEKDALEEAEDRLEEEVRKKKKAKGGDAGDAEEPEFSDEDEEDKMDVESEEEEDENEDEEMAIRKPRAGATKRKRVAIEEEEGEEE